MLYQLSYEIAVYSTRKYLKKGFSEWGAKIQSHTYHTKKFSCPKNNNLSVFLTVMLILKMNLLIKIKVGLPKLFRRYVFLFQ